MRLSAKKPSPKMMNQSTNPPVDGGWTRGLLKFGRKDSEDVVATRTTVKRRGIVRKAKLSDRCGSKVSIFGVRVELNLFSASC